ncbi:MAG: DUF3795 domain-containing protein [Methanosarcinaceae archaeon]|nr:DUF3795 domain-containing protein [Methanosarcinaceae archaeon]
MNSTTLPIDPQLIAPCGMNCAICSSYLAYENEIPRKRGKVTYCKGCRPRNKQCAFLKKRCEDELKLLKGDIDFCFECNCFPCEGLERLDQGYRKKYDMSMIENLNEIKETGISRFIKDQYEKYKCSECGNLISVHNKKCFVCDDIDSLKD